MSKLTKRLTIPRVGATANVVPLPDAKCLRWEVVPHEGRQPHTIDLTAFAEGAADIGISARPQLIQEIVPSVRAYCIGKSTSTKAHLLTGLRNLWRFLDQLETQGGGPVSTLADIDHCTGQLLKTWLLRDRKLGVSPAKTSLDTVRSLLSAARKHREIADWDLLWPTIQKERGTVGATHKDVDPAVLRPLYLALKSHYSKVIAARTEGARLQASGCDPRLVGRGTDRSAWSAPANIAWLANNYVQGALAGSYRSALAACGDRYAQPKSFGLPLVGPSFIPVDDRIPTDRVRWFVPTLTDTAAAYFLVLLHTGWNPDTVDHIDVSADEEWCDWRLGREADARSGTVALYAFKGRAGKPQIAFSLVRPFAHPYQIIRTLIEWTEPLREALRQRLKTLESGADLTPDERRDVADLRRMVRSPFLYFRNPVDWVVGGVGAVAMLSPWSRSEAFRTFCREAHRRAVSARRDDSERYDGLLRLTPSDIRDGFASFVYDHSLSNILLVKRALGHGSVSTTRAYLRQRRQVAERFEAFRQFQAIFFDEVSRFRQVDPTILYLRARFGDLDEDQRQRLADHRMRTRMAMGCIDPANPPSDMAPEHRGGLCSVQRCTICRHGVVFEGSLPGLARRAAELEFIRTRTAQERFEGSTFQAEWTVILAMVKALYPTKEDGFDVAIRAHLALLRADKVYLFDEIPPSFFQGGMP